MSARATVDTWQPTGPQAELLLYLTTDPGDCVSDIGRVLCRPQPVVSRWLERLGKFRLVRLDREVQGEFGMRPMKIWKLTRAGYELADKLAAVW